MYINAPNGQQKPNMWRKKEGVKRIGRPAENSESFDDDEKCRGYVHIRTDGGRVPDSRSCNSEAVGAK